MDTAVRKKELYKRFSISKYDTVSDNINRILTDQLDYMLEHCREQDGDVHRSIHEIRKSIKRIRAVLRLIREDIGYSTYHRENVFYRDINRGTSDLRNYNVLLQTLEKIQLDLGGKLPPGSLAPLLENISSERQKLLSQISSDECMLSDLAGVLMKARNRIEDLPVSGEGFDVFEGGMHRIYRQGKKYLKTAKEVSDTHHLHDMRKRMKYLWYQVEVLKPLYPGPLKAYARSLENVTEKLGLHHDLAVLEEYLAKSRGGIDKTIKQTLIDACRFRQEALIPGILRMAEAAYIEEPDAFVHRMGEYWRIFHRQNSNNERE